MALYKTVIDESQQKIVVTEEPSSWNRAKTIVETSSNLRTQNKDGGAEDEIYLKK